MAKFSKCDTCIGRKLKVCDKCTLKKYLAARKFDDANKNKLLVINCPRRRTKTLKLKIYFKNPLTTSFSICYFICIPSSDIKLITGNYV